MSVTTVVKIKFVSAVLYSAQSTFPVNKFYQKKIFLHGDLLLKVPEILPESQKSKPRISGNNLGMWTLVYS